MKRHFTTVLCVCSLLLGCKDQMREEKTSTVGQQPTDKSYNFDSITKNCVIVDSGCYESKIKGLHNYCIYIYQKNSDDTASRIFDVVNTTDNKPKLVNSSCSFILPKSDGGSLSDPYSGILSNDNGFSVSQMIPGKDGAKLIYDTFFEFDSISKNFIVEKIHVINLKTSTSKSEDPLDLPDYKSDTMVINGKELPNRSLNKLDVNYVIEKYH